MVGKIALNALLDHTFGTNIGAPSTEPDVTAPFSFLETVRGKTRQQSCIKLKEMLKYQI